MKHLYGDPNKTKYFLDSEFYENGSTIDLISIGLVCDDGRTYYACNVEANFAVMSKWLVDNVIPKLPPLEHEAWKTRKQIAKDILAFTLPGAGSGTTKPEFFAYYADYDWVALCQLYGTMMGLPKHMPMFCWDLKQLSVQCGSPEHPPQDSAGEHNALEDAKWNEALYEFLKVQP